MFLIIFFVINISSSQYSGSCGYTLEYCSWEFNTTSKNLEIKGNGDMSNFKLNSSPWNTYRDQILTVTVKGVTSIGSYAFSLCTSLNAISISESVRGIGDYAFSECKSLKSFSIFSGQSYFGHYLFKKCDSLTSIEIPINCSSRSAVNDSFSGINNFVTLYLTGNGPSTEYLIGTTNSPWYNLLYNFNTIVIQVGITSIPQRYFKNLPNLQYLFIPETVSLIGSDAFEGTSSMVNVVYAGLNAPTCKTVYSKLKFEVKVRNSYNYSSFCFKNVTKGFEGSCGDSCYWKVDSLMTQMKINGTGVMENLYPNPWIVFLKVLKNITIEGLETIRNYAFQKSYLLQSVTIPDSVTSIGSNAFSTCYSLQSILIPERVISIGSEAFHLCKSLKSISIPEGITSINDYLFGACSSLESIIIPKSVKSIGSNAFAACKSLKSIRDGIYFFGAHSFSDSGIESIVIGDGNEDDERVIIGNSAFSNCNNLQNVIIKPRFKHNTSTASCVILESAFSSCRNIKSFIIDGYVEIISRKAFTFNAINPVDFEYRSSSSPRSCSNRDPRNSSILLPIFSSDMEFVKVPKNYQSTVLCPCDRYGCPTSYVMNNQWNKIQNASVLIYKTLDEQNNESSGDESSFNKEISESSENGHESSGNNEVESSSNESCEEDSNKGSSNEENESSSKESSKNEKDDSSNQQNESSFNEAEDSGVMISLLTVLLFTLIII